MLSFNLFFSDEVSPLELIQRPKEELIKRSPSTPFCDGWRKKICP